MKTEEFQRLRHINQLGVFDNTYPGASHSRFAQFIGVTHLMKRFIDKILPIKESLERLKYVYKDVSVISLF